MKLGFAYLAPGQNATVSFWPFLFRMIVIEEKQSRCSEKLDRVEFGRLTTKVTKEQLVSLWSNCG